MEMLGGLSKGHLYHAALPTLILLHTGLFALFGQALILLSQNIELMAPDTNDAAGIASNMTGLAVRT